MDKNTNEYEGVLVSLTEEMVLNPSALPEKLQGWRRYRIEYGGHAECCVKELPIYLPMFADPYLIDLLFDFWQAESTFDMAFTASEIMRELKAAIKRRHSNPAVYTAYPMP